RIQRGLPLGWELGAAEPYFVSAFFSAFFASLAALRSALSLALSAFSFSLSAVTAALSPALRSALIFVLSCLTASRSDLTVSFGACASAEPAKATRTARAIVCSFIGFLQ